MRHWLAVKSEFWEGRFSRPRADHDSADRKRPQGDKQGHLESTTPEALSSTYQLPGVREKDGMWGCGREEKWHFRQLPGRLRDLLQLLAQTPSSQWGQCWPHVLLTNHTPACRLPQHPGASSAPYPAWHFFYHSFYDLVTYYIIYYLLRLVFIIYLPFKLREHRHLGFLYWCIQSSLNGAGI